MAHLASYRFWQSPRSQQALSAPVRRFITGKRRAFEDEVDLALNGKKECRNRDDFLLRKRNPNEQ
jgi:hypothetical protein